MDAARPYSLGAKMTGAGGGGCMVAMVNPINILNSNGEKIEMS